MKPFDLEKAKQGAPVCTRNGQPARIICWDKKGKYPIAALVDYGDSEEFMTFAINGRFNSIISKSDHDLFMVERKHEGWVNIYKNNHCEWVDCEIFKTEEDAKSHTYKGEEDYITATKIEWEG